MVDKTTLKHDLGDSTRVKQLEVQRFVLGKLGHAGDRHIIHVCSTRASPAPQDDVATASLLLNCSGVQRQLFPSLVIAACARWTCSGQQAMLSIAPYPRKTYHIRLSRGGVLQVCGVALSTCCSPTTRHQDLFLWMPTTMIFRAKGMCHSLNRDRYTSRNGTNRCAHLLPACSDVRLCCLLDLLDALCVART